jgi:alpha/beta superfamily hydrolase
VAERAYYLDLPHGEVWCCLHQPAGPVRGGVLICSPLYADLLANYGREVSLARALAGQGIAAARFHYPGTGNSGGEPAASSWMTMVSAGRAVAAHLAEVMAGSPIGLVGTRVGALLAADVSSSLPGAPLVVWEPVLDPARYVRDGIRAGLARAAREGTSDGRTTETALTELAERGSTDLIGFRVEQLTYDSLLTQTLPRALGEGARDVLFVPFALNGRVGNGVRKVGAELEALGSQVTIAAAAVPETWWFYSERYLPSGSLIPDTVAWLADRLGDTPAGERPTPGPRAVAVRTGLGFVEQPMWMGARSHDVFGVLAEPEGRPAAGVSLQCWGAGAYPTFGRNGIRARLSAALASHGLADRRIDYAGVGESTGEPQDVRLDQPAIRDARSAVKWLDEHRDGVPRFLIGSCYGSRVALKVAPHVKGLQGIVLLAPPIRDEAHLGAAARAHAVRYGLRRALHLHVLLNLRDPVKRRSYVRFVRQLAKIRRDDEVRRRLEPSDGASTQFLEAFQGVVDQRVPVLIVHAGASIFHADFQRARSSELGLLLARAGDLVDVTVFEDAPNLYVTVDLQEQVVARVERWMLDHLPEAEAPEEPDIAVSSLAE